MRDQDPAAPRAENTVFIQTNDSDRPVKKIVIDQIDNNKYQNVKVTGRLNWFYAVCSATLLVIGVFLGISLCCLCILYA